MNVAEVMQKVDGVWTQEAGAVVPAPMPDGSPEEKLTTSNPTVTRMALSPQFSATASEKVSDKMTGLIKMLPMESANTAQLIKESIAIDGSKT